MKIRELRELPEEELKIRLDQTSEEYFNLRFQNATGQLDNFNQLGQAKREIAQIKTLIQERALGIEVAIAAPDQPETDERPRRRWRKTEQIKDEPTETSVDDEAEEEDK